MNRETTPRQKEPAANPRRHPRHQRRAAQHESAHSDAHPEPPPPPDLPLVPRSAPTLISTDAELHDLIAHLRTLDWFVFDSEFIGEASYHPRLCLIQVATPDRIALIDTLAELDSTPFWRLVAEASIEKVVHAGAQDVEPAFRYANAPPANIFDTQIAAGFAGMAFPASLSKLIQHALGVKLAKSFTFTDWSHRPLTRVQLRYAADDVRYLPALRAFLVERLESSGHAAWARAESEALCDASLHLFDAERDYLKVRGAGGLEPRGLAVLKALFGWRDRSARDADLPPRSFLRDEVLVDLARRPPKSVADLSRVKGLPRPVEAEHGEQIVALARKALEGPYPPALATPGDEPPDDRFRIDALWSLVETACFGRGIDPAVVGSRQDAASLFRALRDGNADHHRLMTGWRGEAVGRLVREVLAGRVQLRLGGGGESGLLFSAAATAP